MNGFQEEFQILINLMTEQFSILAQTILDELQPSVSGSCLHMTSSLHETALICIYGFHGKLCSQTLISGSVPEPTQWCPAEKHACF